MVPRLALVAAGLTVLLFSPALAQSPAGELTAAQVAVACAPPPTLAEAPKDKLRIIASQDTVGRNLFGKPELLVIGGGSQRGVQLGQAFFLRRVVKVGEATVDSKPHSVHTAGWGRVVAVSDATAILTVDYACSEVFAGDYLEPFAAPQVTGDITAVDTAKEPDFTALSRVVFAADERRTAGIGEFVMIDRGAETGVASGAPFAIYRNLGVSGAPLMSIGEGSVVSVGARMSVVRINRARDVVFSGDYAVPRTK